MTDASFIPIAFSWDIFFKCMGLELIKIVKNQKIILGSSALFVGCLSLALFQSYQKDYKPKGIVKWMLSFKSQLEKSQD